MVVEKSTRELKLRLLIATAFLSIGLFTAAFAENYKSKIDKTYVAKGFGKPIKISGQNRYPLVVYTKILEKDGKLTVCGAQYGLMDKRFTGKASIKVDDERLIGNINFFHNITNKSSIAEARKEAKTKEEFFQMLTKPEKISEVAGLTSSCRKTRKKWNTDFEGKRPDVVIPSKITVYTRS